MFYKKTITETSIGVYTFTEGSGFYLITGPHYKDLVYFNFNDQLWYFLGEAKTTPKEILDLFEDDIMVIEGPAPIESPKESPGYVSESFALKAMAIAKAKSIKLTDILK